MEKEQPNAVASSSESSSSSSEEEEEAQAPVKNKPEAVTPKPKVVLALQAKRHNDDDNNDDAEEETPEAKKSKQQKQQLTIQRLWSDDDEITLLEGVIDYYSCNKKEKGGTGVEINDTQSLYNHVKKFVQLNASKSQVVEKIRRLKKKYHNNLKGRKGMNPTFSKAHDQKAFDLSKKIWGGGGGGGGCENNKRTSSSSSAAAAANKLLFQQQQQQGVEEFVVSHGMEMIEGDKKAELEERWKKLKVAQLELFLQRNELINDQAKLLLDSIN